jgi:hypothetical protein
MIIFFIFEVYILIKLFRYLFGLLSYVNVNKAKPIKFLFDAHNLCLIFICCAHFSGQFFLIFNAKVEDIIALSHTKKFIWNDRKFTLFLVLNILGEDKGSFDGLLPVTISIPPKSNTHISIALTISSFGAISSDEFITC